MTESTTAATAASDGTRSGPPRTRWYRRQSAVVGVLALPVLTLGMVYTLDGRHTRAYTGMPRDNPQIELQTLRGQIELFRHHAVSGTGSMPAEDIHDSGYPRSLVTAAGWSDLVDNGYLWKSPPNKWRRYRNTIQSGPTLAEGERVADGVAWYWETTRGILFVVTADGTLLDF